MMSDRTREIAVLAWIGQDYGRRVARGVAEFAQQGLTRLEKAFDKPDDFSLASHFQGAFGVFQTGKKQKIRAEFTGWAATNLREMQWHPSQKIVKDDGDRVIATFELGNTVEFKRWVLGFGGHATVVSPTDLVAEVRAELQRALGKYRAGKANG